MNIKKVS